MHFELKDAKKTQKIKYRILGGDDHVQPLAEQLVASWIASEHLRHQTNKKLYCLHKNGANRSTSARTGGSDTQSELLTGFAHEVLRRPLSGLHSIYPRVTRSLVLL
jgi:hypothetical protein